jgi:hypothetical protein
MPAQPLLVPRSECNASSSSFPSQPQPTPKQNFFDPASTASGVFIKRSSRASPNFDSRTLLPFFRVAFRKTKASFLQGKHAIQRINLESASLPIHRISDRDRLRSRSLLLPRATDPNGSIRNQLFTFATKAPHPQSRCLPDSISLSTRSYPLNDDLPVVAEADAFIALRPPLPRQPVVLRKTLSMPRVLSRVFPRDRRAQVVKARF